MALMSAFVAKAVLPALILPVAEVVQALVIRSAGRQAIIELSTAAANDTTFAAAVTAVRGTQVAAWLGFGAVAAAYPVNTDVPVAPTLASEKYSVAVGPIGTTANYKPAYISQFIRLNTLGHLNLPLNRGRFTEKRVRTLLPRSSQRPS
jgi:hypothetical protein